MKNADRIQVIANVATTIGLIVAISVFVVEIKASRQERTYQSFLTLLSNYQNIVSERKNNWKKIKEKIRENPKTAHEIHDKQDSISYLLIRMSQPEPMYAVEHGLLDGEIKSLNFLDELCRLAVEDERAMQILLLTDLNEISYYKNRLKDLLKLYESQRSIILFQKPRYMWLNKVDVKEYF